MQPARKPRGCPDALDLAFLASPTAIRDNLTRIMADPRLGQLPDGMRRTVELVLAEVLNNVAEHAYAEGPGPVAITITPGQAGLFCLVVDQGSAMPDGHLPEGLLPDAAASLEDLPEGGFGWHLIRSLTHDLAYARTGGCNRLSFLVPHDG